MISRNGCFGTKIGVLATSAAGDGPERVRAYRPVKLSPRPGVEPHFDTLAGMRSPTAGSERLASPDTPGLTALGEGLADGGVVGHRVECYEVTNGPVAHHDLVGHGVDERPSGSGVDVGEEGQPQR